MALVVLAILIDAIVGDPPTLWQRVGHPVTWFGKAIDALDLRLNRGAARRQKGVLAIAALALGFGFLAAVVAGALALLPGPVGLLVEAALASSLIAHRSLHQHVAAVADAPTLAEARRRVAMIVGRDTASLEEAGIARASIETLSESLSDGVVAPLFWLAVAGLPGLVVYKVVNTADSMIGHRTPRHEAFGAAAARLDDLMNLVPARLTAALVILARPALRHRFAAIKADADRHVSPNAGWPEAAFAHALGVSLGGPRTYAGRLVDGVRLNAGGRAPDRSDVRAGLALSRQVGLIEAGLYALLALAAALA
ncbi:adenosylcobinamide-phosphate synthase CbiB [Acuticoccus mangrovi]|uniref:Cobalamin biosynthesis protein CobD n=1 Tax=Acuticoccus mangrovi TaxID=2796142 RepID=A0A934IL78_9HYPH|nr:adenosylcobinamide-phosphate synthase CbiB [Acuticoccus mangrovi]MBJ3774353.1 cobalamin biosynthesis protein CobD [Acuticoccus mangrovi]